MGKIDDLKFAAKEADRCVACGLCLPTCPTYREIGSEADSPRGRIQLINAVAQGKLAPTEKFVRHIDLCLSCRSCENVCPNGVRYGRLIDAARAFVAPASGSSLYRTLLWILKKRRRIATLGRILRLAQVAGIKKLAGLLPKARAANQLLPVIPPQPAWRDYYPANPAKGEVALFLGCASSIADPLTLQATIFVVNRLGYTVHVPAAQCCCGGIARQHGDAAASADMLERNARAFASLGKMPILSVASGCGMGLRDHLGTQVTDISAFLANADWQDVGLSPLPVTIHVHDACSLRNVMHQHRSVYELLKKIPQADIQPLPGNEQCCGGAGSYMLTQPEMAGKLQDDKIQACRSVGVRLLVTANIGCALHIAAGLRKEGMAIELIHPVQLLARQLGFQE